jgi:hypothetical protein
VTVEQALSQAERERGRITPTAVHSRAAAVLDAIEAGEPAQVVQSHCLDAAAGALALAGQIAWALESERRWLPPPTQGRS